MIKGRIADVRAAGLVVHVKGLGEAREKHDEAQQDCRQAAHLGDITSAYAHWSRIGVSPTQ